MNGKTPHIVQYQGSKRLLAPQILQYMPRKVNRFIEPFSGMAAITIAAAKESRASEYHVNDINKPIIRILQTAIGAPDELIKKYTAIWTRQFSHPGGHLEHFYYIRNRFNEGEQTAENMLYLLARCVKGSVRYGRNGNFNQSPDKRRHGTNPKNIANNVYAISSLLKGKVVFTSLDYRQIFDAARQGDLIYLDPPYQGVTNAKDNRYFSGLSYDEFAKSITYLDKKGIDYIISYDGECGGRAYGSDLPSSLNCVKFLLNAGTSTQATLLGKRSTTFESLYVSKRIAPAMEFIPEQLTLTER
ncbi:MAG: Dam family site-specific DNA-(adenine-N6)-methyltransferase [Defluviitaleaceae bacterium]|nr:Dam family site-specific DNA-(adenine-N6)-methyltransferase [Defluviitaleaceae bacterium]MCL2238829.1 Dam family site-specific DNA-(adenine-N6)-methyltransferase [Defluviitaleaceae bacterium]